MLDGIALLALGQSIGLAVLHDAPLPDKGIALVFALAVVIATLASAPDRPERWDAARGLPATWSATAGAAAAMLIIANTRGRVRMDAVVAVSAGVALLAVVAHRATAVVGSALGSRSRGRLAVMIAFVLAGAAPIWLGPLLEAFGGPAPGVDGVLASSPLTYLAVLSGYDYLRQDWFYTHSTVASLRFVYPEPLTLTVVYLALALVLLLVDRVSQRRRNA